MSIPSLHAFVCPTAEIIAFVKERLAAYKYPRIVQFVDTLPKGPTGKILKKELKAQLEAAARA